MNEIKHEEKIKFSIFKCLFLKFKDLSNKNFEVILSKYRLKLLKRIYPFNEIIRKNLENFSELINFSKNKNGKLVPVKLMIIIYNLNIRKIKFLFQIKEKDKTYIFTVLTKMKMRFEVPDILKLQSEIEKDLINNYVNEIFIKRM